MVAYTNWTHIWFDMHPYLGQTGTLQFRLQRAGGDQSAYLALDNISLSSWDTPIITNAGPLDMAPSDAPGAWIDISGEHFSPSARLFVGSTEITAIERTGSTHFRFQLPVNIRGGRYLIKVVNPRGAEAYTAQPLTLYYYIALPVINQ